MDWKNFLKPTKKTIIVFLVFLALTGIYSWYATPCPLFNRVRAVDIQGKGDYITGPDYFSLGTCGTLSPEGLFVLWWPLGIGVQFLFNSGSAGSMIEVLWRVFVLLTAFTLNLFYFYLLVVLFIKLLDKFKG